MKAYLLSFPDAHLVSRITFCHILPDYTATYDSAAMLYGELVEKCLNLCMLISLYIAQS